MKTYIAAALTLVMSFPAIAQQAAEPSETTERFGAWTVRCVNQQGENEGKACEVFLAVQGQGGLIAQIALGQPQQAGTLMVARTPLGVLVSEPVRLETAGTPPLTLPFVTCLANGCLAQSVVPGDFLGELTGHETASATFAERSGRQIQINLPLTGLNDALARIGVDCGSGSCVPAE
ncbi:MAG: invasion associated locus B family protein [Rhizobiaceae bacterium]|nr:invasion associated locus B family protein [Rhizobiaceae bacterium]